MGEHNKLLLKFNDQTMVSHVIDQLVESNVSDIIVVTGNDFEEVTKSIKQQVKFTHNPDYNLGLSASLKAGISALPNGADGVMICLGDMPYISASHYNDLITAFVPGKIIVPTSNGKIGNPLIFSKEYFIEFKGLSGDKGARKLIKEYQNDVVRVDLGTDAIFNDIDTPDAYQDIMDQF